LNLKTNTENDPTIPPRQRKKRQLTAVWLYFLFGGDSALFNISAIMNGSAFIKLLCFNPLTKNIAKPQTVTSKPKKKDSDTMTMKFLLYKDKKEK